MRHDSSCALSGYQAWPAMQSVFFCNFSVGKKIKKELIDFSQKCVSVKPFNRKKWKKRQKLKKNNKKILSLPCLLFEFDKNISYITKSKQYCHCKEVILQSSQSSVLLLRYCKKVLPVYRGGTDVALLFSPLRQWILKQFRSNGTFTRTAWFQNSWQRWYRLHLIVSKY